MAQTDYGSLDLGPSQTTAAGFSEAARTRRIFGSAVLALLCVTMILSHMTVPLTGTSQVAAVVDAGVDVKDIPDCQCLSTCNTPDDSHPGSWCYIDTDISPCMSATHRVVYGATWTTCTVIYGDDDCAGGPCQNEAFCVDKYDGFDCECRSGWSGDDCTTQVLVEYTVHFVASSMDGASTDNAIFVTFVGTEGDMTQQHMLSSTGIGEFERKVDGDCPDLTDANPGVITKTFDAQDIGDLHKVSYSVGGDDSFKPSQLRVEVKGKVYVATGELQTSESLSVASAIMVQARQYNLHVEAVDSPEWAGTTDDVFVQLTGEDWEVTGEVVAIPGGIDDAIVCDMQFYGADVGTPAKITYWVAGVGDTSDNCDNENGCADDFLPGKLVVDSEYAAIITTGARCYGSLFEGDDSGRGFAYTNTDCSAGDNENGCTGTKNCRWCVLWDPEADSHEVLCPWVLPFTDGRYIIVDLVNTEDLEEEEEEADVSEVAAGAAVQ